MKKPVRQLDIAIAGALGMPQGPDEGVVADPVQLPGYGFKADIGHGFS
jgi:hypothetical protein